MLCHLCIAGESHCFGKSGMVDPICMCECRHHMLPQGDIRFLFISLLTAEAHDDFALLKVQINDLSHDELKASLLLAVKYAISLSKQYGENPVEVVRAAALYWAGGTPTEDED